MKILNTEKTELRLAGTDKPSRLIVVLDPHADKRHVCDVWCTHPAITKAEAPVLALLLQ